MAMVIPNKGHRQVRPKNYVNASPVLRKWAGRGSLLIGKGD